MKPASIFIYDAAGRLVSERLSNAYYESFSLQQLTPGMYSVVVIQEGNKGFRKFIVQ